MQHIQGISRNQLQMSSLEDTITADNPPLTEVSLLLSALRWSPDLAASRFLSGREALPASF